MTRPVVVLMSRRGRDSIPPHLWQELTDRAVVRVERRDDAPGEDEAVRLLADADLLGATNVCLPRLDAALLARLPRLVGVVLLATGYDHVDVGLLRGFGVGLSVLPEYATEAVAEHGLALLLGLATRLHLANDRGRGLADRSTSLRGVELRGRTVGIVGVGRIGGRLAELAAGLGMTVLGTDIDPVAVRRGTASGVTMTSLAALLSASSAVAVCASAAYGARPILTTEQVRQLPPGALLVNVARPGLVDTPSVVAGLRAGHLRGYAVDDRVLDPVEHADLLAQGRVLQTDHSAWWRDEVLERGARMWGEHLLAAVAGAPLDAVTWPRPVDLSVAPASSPAHLRLPDPAVSTAS